MSERESGHGAAIIKAESDERISAVVQAAKFKMFFAGLTFATLSFVGAHPLATSSSFLKSLEVVSLISLFISGVIMLAHLGEIKIILPNKLNWKWIIQIASYYE